MTFAALRSLYALIGDALDDIERVYQDASFDAPPATPATPYDVLASPTTPYRRHRTLSSLEEDETGPIHFPMGRPPKTPRRGHRGAGSSTDFQLLDFPALDNPYYPTEGHAQEEDAAESLASHPDVIAATNRIVAACGQIGATVHRPFLTLCDAAMGVRIFPFPSDDSLNPFSVSSPGMFAIPRGVTYRRDSPDCWSGWDACSRLGSTARR